jgi:hypothetical protein
VREGYTRFVKVERNTQKKICQPRFAKAIMTDCTEKARRPT